MATAVIPPPTQPQMKASRADRPILYRCELLDNPAVERKSKTLYTRSAHGGSVFTGTGSEVAALFDSFGVDRIILGLLCGKPAQPATNVFHCSEPAEGGALSAPRRTSWLGSSSESFPKLSGRVRECACSDRFRPAFGCIVLVLALGASVFAKCPGPASLGALTRTFTAPDLGKGAGQGPKPEMLEQYKN